MQPCNEIKDDETRNKKESGIEKENETKKEKNKGPRNVAYPLFSSSPFILSFLLYSVFRTIPSSEPRDCRHSNLRREKEEKQRAEKRGDKKKETRKKRRRGRKKPRVSK